MVFISVCLLLFSKIVNGSLRNWPLHYSEENIRRIWIRTIFTGVEIITECERLIV